MDGGEPARPGASDIDRPGLTVRITAEAGAMTSPPGHLKATTGRAAWRPSSAASGQPRPSASTSDGPRRAFIVVTALGMDQGFGDGPAPMIFGTVALDEEGEPWQGQERVAASEARALDNHRTLNAELS